MAQSEGAREAVVGQKRTLIKVRLGSRASNQRVERAAHSAAAHLQYVCVDHGRCHVRVSEQVLICADVVSVLQQVRLEAVAKPLKADEGLAPMRVCLLGAPAVMQVTNPFAHLIQQPRCTQGRHRIRRDQPQCCARLRRTRVSQRHRIVLAAARRSPNLYGADMAGTVGVTAAASGINLVLQKTTLKLHSVQRH